MSPEPLPEPPADYGLLIDFPTLGKDDVPPRLYRVHRVDRAAEWFSTSGTMRFDPPGGAADLFGTCYLAVDPVTALIEAVGDLPSLTHGTSAAHGMQRRPKPRGGRAQGDLPLTRP